MGMRIFHTFQRSSHIILTVCLGFVYIALVNSQSCLDLQFDKEAYEDGQDTVVQVSCIIDQSTCNVLPNQLAVTVNNVALLKTQDGSFLLQNISMEDNNKTVVCRGGSYSAEKMIRIGVKPTKPYDLDCVVSNVEIMTCTWKPKIQLTGLNTVQTLMFSKNTIRLPDQTVASNCPAYTDLNTCVFEDDFQKNYHYTIRVSAENDLGVRYERLQFHDYERVKLNKIKDLSLTVTKTAMSMSWKRPVDSHLILSIWYELTVDSQWQADPFFVTLFKDAHRHVHVVTYNIPDLIPHTLYTVSIRCIVPNTYQRWENLTEWWSEVTSDSITTHSDVPAVAPLVTSGGFVRKEAEIKVFWQPVPDVEVQGEIRRIRVEIHPRQNDSDIPSCISTSESKTMLLSPDEDEVTVEHGQTYDICVDVQNEVGYNESIVLEPVRIPLKDYDFPKFYVVEHQNFVQVHLLSMNPSLSYTLFWCEGIRQKQECSKQTLESFNWTVIEQPVTRLFSGMHIGNNPVIAMSAEYPQPGGFVISSGMKYSTSYFFHANRTIQMPKGLKVVRMESQKPMVTISWRTPKAADTAYIDFFRLSYCLKELCGVNATTVDIDAEGQLDGLLQSCTLEGLEAEETYRIKIKSVGDGTSSQYTEEIEATVPSAGLAKSHKIVIGVVAGIGGLLFVIGIYSIISCCKKKVQEYRNPITVVTIPDDVDKEFREQNGKKSDADDPYMEITNNGTTNSVKYWPGGRLDAADDNTEEMSQESHNIERQPPDEPPAHGDPDTTIDVTHHLLGNSLNSRMDSNGTFRDSGQPLLPSSSS